MLLTADYADGTDKKKLKRNAIGVVQSNERKIVYGWRVGGLVDSICDIRVIRGEKMSVHGSVFPVARLEVRGFSEVDAATHGPVGDPTH
ncbi:MAG: hypothetical protein ACI9VS_000997, partial [Candidatus Binatia bacterium]